MHLGINSLLLWGQFSGVEMAIDRLITALAQLDTGHTFTLFVGRDFSGVVPDRSNWRAYRCPVLSRNRAARVLWEQARLPSLARELRLDVLHAPGYVAPLRCRIPAVLSVYDLFALTHPHLSQRHNVWHYRLFLPPSVRRASQIIVPTRYVRNELVSRLRVPSERVTVIPLGVGPEFHPVTDATRTERVRNRYRLSARYLLFVGNLEPKKNLPRLLKAFAAADAPAEVQLVLAGKRGWERTALPALARQLDVQRRTSFLGYVPRRDLPVLYSLAEAAVFPSLCEGFGMPALEAMACGTPVITSDVTGIGEVVSTAARIVDPYSTSSIAAAIEEVTSHPALRMRLSAAGLKRARLFSWERTARETLRVYELAAVTGSTASGRPWG